MAGKEKLGKRDSTENKENLREKEAKEADYAGEEEKDKQS